MTELQTTPAPDSSGSLSDGLRQLARTTKLDADATIRAGATRVGHLLHDTLPQLHVAEERDADIQLLDTLGEGGMGDVRLARQRGLDREVAVKQLKRDGSGDAAAALLTREGIVTGRLEHPNIVPVHMLGRDTEGRPIIVMKRVEGRPWSADVERSGWSTDATTQHLEVFIEVCKAVAFAHAQEIVHRDIKPSNVMIGAFGEVYLLDWGIATEAGIGAFDHVMGDEPGMPLGTPLYMAPEMTRTRGVIDQRTDIFLLGATLHRMLTGRPRHRGEDLVTVLSEVARAQRVDYGETLPDELGAILNRATAREPEMRFQTVEALRDAVQGYLRHRHSIELAMAAEVQLKELERQVSDDDPIAVRRLATECRFAFMRALEDWAANARAQKGLERCLRTMARFELELGQLDTASTLLEEMRKPDDELVAALNQARDARRAEEAELEALRADAHERDLRVHGVPRAVVVILFSVMVVFMSLGMIQETPVFEVTPLGGIYAMMPFIAIYLGALIIWRETLLSTAVNRQLIYLLGIGIFFQTINRGLAHLAGGDFAHMLAVDLLGSAGLLGAAAVMIDRKLAIPAVIWLIGGVAIVLLPFNRIFAAYGPSQIGGLLLIGFFWYRQRTAR